jgi:hypothetical protein
LPKSVLDESALAGMCGGDEDLWLIATACWKVAMACAW